MPRLWKKIIDGLAELETKVLVELKASYRGCDKPPLTVGRQAGSNIVLGQFREVAKDLLVGLAGRQPTEHVRDRNPHVADARPAAALTRFDGNDVLVVHGKNPSIIPGSAQQCLVRHFNQR